MPEQSQVFGRVRSFFWPIYSYELKKLLPMMLIFFLVSFNYNVLRNLKDALIVTAKSSGAEVIPFIKVWVMLPMAIVMTLIFTKLCSKVGTRKAFYIIIVIFLSYFFIFTVFLYPNQHALHLHGLADYLQDVFPLGAKGFVAMLRYWMFTLFYVMAELWSNIVLSVLFWGFANEITKVSEAKRFYGLFGLIANISGVIAGKISLMACYGKFKMFITYGTTPWEQTLFNLLFIIFISSFLIMLIHRWICKNVITDPNCVDSQDMLCHKKKKMPKFSLRESITYLSRSTYVLYIAIIVVVYNLIINLLEVLWKDQVKMLYPSPQDFMAYMNKVTMWTGFVATFIAIFITSNALRKLGWTKTAMITPLVLLVTSLSFFSMLFYGHTHLSSIIISFGSNPLLCIVLLGTVNNVMSRASKYTVFDATKELSFIPLSKDIKYQAKAAIDGVGSRFGKSGGSLVHQTLLIFFSSISSSAPYIAIIFLLALTCWILAVRFLGQEFKVLTQSTEEQDQAPLKPSPVASTP